MQQGIISISSPLIDITSKLGFSVIVKYLQHFFGWGSIRFHTVKCGPRKYILHQFNRFLCINSKNRHLINYHRNVYYQITPQMLPVDREGSYYISIYKESPTSMIIKISSLLSISKFSSNFSSQVYSQWWRWETYSSN